MTRAAASVAAVLFVSAFLAAPAARAAGDDDVKRATTEYAAGMDLRQAGKLAASLEQLELAHRTYPTPITGLELGRGYMLLGRLLEARDTLLSVARIGPRAGESARANNARAEAAGIAAALGERIPRVVFEHEGAPPAVTVDGKPVQSIDVPLLLDPGEHTVAWSGATRKVTLAEGQAVTVVVSVAAAPAATGPAAPVPTGSVSAAGHEARGGNRAPFWLALGLTGAATAVGSVAGVVAIGKANDARPGCPNGQCQTSVHGAADEAKTWSTVSTVSFVAAGVLGAVTVVAFLLTHDGHDTAKETARLGSLSVSF
ncbi:MAG TPA: hypothetical protein VGG39_22020 [Polyangiaceae bacterium]|jgi:hypothetical protein